MRRSWLVVVLVVAASALALPASAGAATPIFTHGVASGDVTASKAILWTRAADASANLRVEVWPNASCQTGQKAFQQSNIRPSAARDFTVKVDASGLTPNTQYCYVFRHGNTASPIGRFKTAPAANVPANVEFTYTGDSDGTKVGGSPFFNNFEVLDRAREENSDFFGYIGDTIYSDSSLRPAPATTVAEYRAAYREAREIAALPNLLKSTSTYAIPDDHEVQNDYDGQTVNPARYAAGRQAFLEYMPIRETGLLSDASCAGGPLFRVFRWGSKVDIIIPDERSCRSGDVAVNPCAGDLAPTLPPPFRPAFGLPPNPPPGCLAAIFDPSRTMLGPVQKQAFKNALLNSTAKFKFVLSDLAIQQFWALPYDRWEGYGAERNEILNFIRSNSIANVVFLTTDNHANIVNEVFIDRFGDPATIANELITGPIATFTLEQEILGAFGPAQLAGFNNALSLAGVDCRDLDTYSYGLVGTDATAGVSTVNLKDDAGAPVINQVPPPVPCTKVFGP